MMVIDNKYELGDMVYLKTDPDQRARIVSAFLIRPGFIEYRLDYGTDFSWHADFVISIEKNIVLTTTN